MKQLITSKFKLNEEIHKLRNLVKKMHFFKAKKAEETKSISHFMTLKDKLKIN